MRASPGEQPTKSARVTRILIVANRTASTPRVIEAVGRRAKASPCELALLISGRHQPQSADWTLETAQRSLRPAARGNVEGLVGGPDPFESVKAAARDGNFDEIRATAARRGRLSFIPTGSGICSLILILYGALRLRA